MLCNQNIRLHCSTSSSPGPLHHYPHSARTRRAEAYGRAGRPQAGLEVLAEAMTLITTREMRWREAEVYRLQGELRFQLPAPDVLQVVAFFLSALDVARRQQAKALELRAACSLSRLKYQQGHLTAACALLSMLGSPKVLTHLIYWRPRPCLQR
jgi:predicted ATPase